MNGATGHGTGRRTRPSAAGPTGRRPAGTGEGAAPSAAAAPGGVTASDREVPSR